MNDKKNVVVIYSGDDWHVDVPISYELTRRAFEKWQNMASEKGIEMFRACINWYDEERDVFTKAWAFRNNSWIKVEKPVFADLIYDKTSGATENETYKKKVAMSKKTLVFNSPAFRRMVDSKLSQYAIFSELMPETLVATSRKDIKDVVEKIKTEKVVVKPFQGSGGFGIKIGSKNEILKNDYEFPVLVQEFISNKNGIPGFSNEGELADLRISFMNHKPVYAISRVAKSGSLFTNQHQGAKSVRVPLEAIPESVWKMTEKIIEKLGIFSKAQYSLDFFFSDDKPYFMEMNSVPGLCIIEELGDADLQRVDFEQFISLLQ